jgi:hypothetical protein
MLTKPLGTSTVFTLSATAQTATMVNTFQTNAEGRPLTIVKVRVATGTQPAFVAFGTSANTSSLILPANFAEHFKLDNTSTVSVLQAGTAGIISITPIA